MTLFDDLQEHPIRAGLDLGRQQAQGLKGFAVTLRHLFRRPVTQAYPEHKRAVYPRFRGRHRLHRHPNGLEKCIGCSLCAAACPADCIRVVAAENEPDARVSPGERYARIYEINMARCIFCGYCEIACPFDAITLGNDFELSELSRDALVYTKEMLLEPPLRRTPAQDPELFDRGAQEIEGAGVLGMYHVYSQNHDEVPGGLMGIAVFYVAGAAAIGSAIAVVVQRNPFLAALSLILHLASLAALYLVLQGDFVAVAQLLVYAGAVMIMFLFVIAYLGRSRGSRPQTRRPRRGRRGPRRPRDLRRERDRRERLQRARSARPRRVVDSFGSPATIGRLFLTDHLLAFEAISLILLVGAIAGVVLGAGDLLPARPRDEPRRARAEGGALRPAARAAAAARKRPQRRARWARDPRHRLLDHALLGALLHRAGRRDAAPQPARDPALARDHAQRGQPAAGRRLALRGRQRRPRARADGDGSRGRRGRRRPRADRGPRAPRRRRSTSTSCGACTDERRRLRLARPAHAAARPRLQHRRRAERLAARRGLGGVALDPGGLRASRCSPSSTCSRATTRSARSSRPAGTGSRAAASRSTRASSSIRSRP